MRTKIDTLIGAMDILSRDIQSDDYVANAAIAEAAKRLREYKALHEAAKYTFEAFSNEDMSLGKAQIMLADALLQLAGGNDGPE